MSAENPAFDPGRIVQALDQHGVEYVMVGGFARELPVVVDAATLRAFGSTTWTTDAGPLDVLTELPVDGGRRAFADLSQRSTSVEFSGVIVQLASLDDIIDSKSHADRPKDHEALPELRHLRSQQHGR